MNFLKHVTSYKQLEIQKLKDKQNKNVFAELFKSNKNLILIGEIKPKSPSNGILLKKDPVVLASEYEKYGIDAISVLTDEPSFGGNIDLLQNIREHVHVPILRKDFILDSSQLIESLQCGADAVLLIAHLLGHQKLKQLISFSYELGLLPIVEISHKKEIKKVTNSGAKVIGVNSRDLTSLKVDIENALKIIEFLPKTVMPLLFSGIQTKHDVRKAFKSGAKGILVGTSLLKASNIKAKVAELKI